MTSPRWLQQIAERLATPIARDRQRGVALLITLTWIALMVALVAEFTYGTSVDSAQAANARDEVRAHYLAESSVNLSRLLIKIQQRFVEPVMTQARQMLTAAMGTGAGAAGGSSTAGASSSAASAGLGISLRVTDYAGPLMGFFSGSKDEVAGLGSLIGIDTTNIKGLGLSSGTFDAEITSEDGKIDLNCGSGIPNSDAHNKQVVIYRLLSGMMFSPRFDRLFSEADADGQFVTRDGVARAIIDWADIDEQGFAIDNLSTSGEDYRYDAQRDRYRAHDNSYYSVDEMKMVRGVTDAFMEAFAPYLTVYAGKPDPSRMCGVNLGAISNKTGGDCTPLLMGVIRAAVLADPTKPPSDNGILDDMRLYPIASLLCDRASAAGFDSLDSITTVLQNPQTAVMPDDPRYKVFQGLRGLDVKKADLAKIAYVGPTRVYRIVATGEAGRVKKKITAILDSGAVPENYFSLSPISEQGNGIIQYWREE
jgi:type II secretory pathway component PulK